ncbi:DedA family protein [Kallotenue papyrolyticum]|uniref:DedA family protein n=1 Tax=Kallotenue papyrolyticum TaxID=1325125 RepID=UPI0004928326|nr:VTT domain-containing protein [Kallotenue papyrolyticum]
MVAATELLNALTQYGPVLVIVVVFLASLGTPLPATLVLLSAGALAAGADWSPGLLVLGATGAAVLGDQLGYALGRWGGQALIARLNHRQAVTVRLARAERLTRRWGVWIIFFSRWLLTPLGPLINLTSGLLHQRWSFFLTLDLCGELVWVSLYVGLGWFFGERAPALSAQVEQLAWLGLGGLVAAGLGAWLSRSMRLPASAQ